MAEYPINHNILAEDFREQRAGKAPFTQEQANWLLTSLNAMCEAYDNLSEQTDELIKEVTELSVSYTPSAIRDAYDGAYETDENAQWVAKATDEQLLDVAYMIVGSDLTCKN